MTAAPKRMRPRDPAQGDLFTLVAAAEQVPVPAEPVREPGALDLSSRIKRLLNEAIDLSVFDREQIAAIMAELVGKPITKAMLDTWTGESRTNRFPAEYLPAFCVAAGNAHVMVQLGLPMGVVVMDSHQARLARMGQYALMTVLAQEQMRVLAESLPPTALFKGA